LLVSRRDLHSLELISDAQIGEETGRVLMEVEKGARSAVEDAAARLSQSGDGSEGAQERLETVQCASASVLHRYPSGMMA